MTCGMICSRYSSSTASNTQHYLNPDIIAIEVDEQTVNLMTASNLALLTAYVLYAKDVFVKLKNLILSKTSGTPPEELAAEQETAE